MLEKQTIKEKQKNQIKNDPRRSKEVEAAILNNLVRRNRTILSHSIKLLHCFLFLFLPRSHHGLLAWANNKNRSVPHRSCCALASMLSAISSLSPRPPFRSSLRHPLLCGAPLCLLSTPESNFVSNGNGKYEPTAIDRRHGSPASLRFGRWQS